mgnify:CR=1 FL=1
MTNKEMFNERMEICSVCPIFNKTTRTCGTPLNKLNPFAEWQEMNGVRFKPCGCFMDVKGRMALQECPAGLWGAVADSNVIEEAKELIKVIKESGKVTGEQRKVLGQLKGIIQGGKAVSLRHCVGCVNKIVDELGHQLKREETELINEVEQPQIKKRGRRKRAQ